jgi:hypothetical protein
VEAAPLTNSSFLNRERRTKLKNLDWWSKEPIYSGQLMLERNSMKLSEP